MSHSLVPNSGDDVHPRNPSSQSGLAHLGVPEIGQLGASRFESAEVHHRDDEDRQHSDEHDGRLEGVVVHDSDNSAVYDVYGDDQREKQEDVVVIISETGDDGQGVDSSLEDRCCVDGHHYEDYDCRECADTLGVVDLSEEIREGGSPELPSDAPGPPSEHDECDDKSDCQIEEAQPEHGHTVDRGLTAETDDG